MRILFTLLIVLSLTACKKDFDELQDTTQRHITFSFDSSQLFADLLHTTGSGYAKGIPNNIPEDCLLRLACYCYDENGRLEAQQTITASVKNNAAITLRHLQKDTRYTFVILADVVKTDAHMGYNERWYQMESQRYGTFNLLTNELSDNAVYNIVRMTSLQTTPENQTIQIETKTLTVNGFIQFTNTDGIILLKGEVTYSSTITLQQLTCIGKNKLRFATDFPNGTDIVWPVTGTCADGAILYTIDITTQAGVKTANISIDNSQCRPFVATFDCTTLQITNCQYY